jgi:23S rRNA pseudouridine1911/1915/1917 synthase
MRWFLDRLDPDLLNKTVRPRFASMSPSTLIVSREEAGRTVGAVLRSRLRISRSEARRLIEGREVRLNGAVCRDSSRRVRPGQRLEVGGQSPDRSRPALNQPVIRYADGHVVVVEKPPGLTTMRHPEEAAEFGARARRFLPPTLADRLPGLLAAARPGRAPAVRAVHRLDKDTSGLVVFALTPQAVRHLGRQFRQHTVERRYLAVVRGKAGDGRIESHLVRDRGDGRRGSTSQPGAGQRAVTHVRVVDDLGEFTLVECRLETGRTHQVRIHLGERGTPLCGERVYDRPLHGKSVKDDTSGFGRPALHAASLGFAHPATGKRMSWTSPLPPDMAKLVTRLRRRGRKRARRGDSHP